jgi:hypothetical protein
MRKELFFAHSLLRTGTQQGLAKWQLQLGLGLDALVQHCRDGTGGFQLETSRDRLRLPAQGGWRCLECRIRTLPLSLGEERGFSQ